MTLEEILAALAEAAKADPAAAAEALRKTVQPVYQIAYTAGHTAAETASAAKITKLEGDVATETAKTAAEKKRADELAAKNPDVEKIAREHAEALRLANEAHATALAAKDAAIATERSARDKADLAVAFVKAGGHEDWAEDFASKAENLARIGRDENGNRRVTTKGSETVFLQVSGTDSVIDVLAREIVDPLPARYKSGTADSGSGTSGSSTGGGGGGYDAAAEGRKMAEEAKKRGGSNDLALR